MLKPPEYYEKAWHLKSVKPLEQTPRGHLFTAIQDHRPVVLKIYVNEKVVRDEAGASHFLKELNGDGAVRILNDDPAALLLEYLDGGHLSDDVDNGPDDVKATKTIAALLNKIHARPVPEKHPYETLEERFQSLFQNRDKESVLEQAADMARHLLDNQTDIRVLHGDVHHHNIMHHSDKGWLFIDPQPVVGDRVYDAANTLKNPSPEIYNDKNRFLEHTQILAEAMKTSQQKLINYAFCHMCLSLSWSIEDGDEYPQSLYDLAKKVVHLIQK